MKNQLYDVIIVGAGISGIGMAYWLRKKCPHKTIAVLEARSAIGGTWSLFQYPGIRSDSDMFTFGYRFKPWTNPQSLSSGQHILQYLQETVQEYDLEKYIHFHHKMTSADWSDTTRTWTLQLRSPQGPRSIQCRFLSICTGYYDYHDAHRPGFKGEEQYQGQIILPQFWPKKLNYRGKKIVIVGSGATAVTLVPALVQGGARQVTMLQRSPTYIVNVPDRNRLFGILKKVLPHRLAYRMTRWQNIGLQMLSFAVSRAFPQWMKGLIMKEAAKQLPAGYPVDKHFNPSYNPWEQRLCVAPDGDLFQAICKGKAKVATDTITHFTEQGIALQSGEELPADLIVLATGLKIQLLGGASLSVNGQPVKVGESMMYKGMMIGGLPNFIYAFGYTNASWTLKVDLTAAYFCKLLRYMDRRHYEVVIPVKPNLESQESFLNLNSGYIERAKDILPKQGARRPWRVYQSYLVDMLATRFGKISNPSLQFLKGNPKILIGSSNLPI